MAFKNREQAARLLATKLSRCRKQRPLVLGIPRGAVPMARIIAEALDGEVDVVLVHKLRAREQPELAIGAIDETGHSYVADYASELEFDASYIASEKQTQLEELRRRRKLYTPVREPIDPAGRIVIVVDDGIATGSSMLAALRSLRARKPARLIVATAVAPPDTVLRIKEEADEVICLETPEMFFAVGQFFQDFSQVSDEEVMAALAPSRAAAVPAAASSPASANHESE
jgi:predicted phosphoribosyltransferase